MGPNEGTVFVVNGSSGKTSGGDLNHPVMVTSLDELGSLVLDVNGKTLDAQSGFESGGGLYLAGLAGVNSVSGPGMHYFESCMSLEKLVFDAQQSGTDGRKRLEQAPFELKPGEALKLRVFVDKSVVEVYANDRQAICRRVYPGDDALGIALFANGGQTKFTSVKAWEMMPSNPY